MPTSSHQANPDDIDITIIGQAIMRNLKWLLIGSFLVGALAYVALSFLKPEFGAQAQIIIENEQAGFKRPTGSSDASAGRVIDKEAISSQTQILQSNDLANIVADELKLNLNPEFNSAAGNNSFFSMARSAIGLGGDGGLPEKERVMKAYYNKLIVYPVKGSRVIAVEFRSQNPSLAVSLANSLAKNYIEFLQSARIDQHKGAQKWLGQEITQLREDVEKAEIKLAKMRSETGLIPGQNNITLNVQQLGEINSRLSLAKAQKSEAVARAKLVRRMLREGSIESAPDVLKSRLIQRLLEQRIQVQRQIAELSATLLSGHPRMVQLRSELSGLKRQIRNEAFKLVKGLENEALIAGAKERSLFESIASVRKSTERQSDAQAKIRVLEREAKSKRELYESYVSRLGDASARQSRLSVPVMARIVQSATQSSVPVFPKKGPIALLSSVGALFLGIVWVVTRGLMQGARKSVSSQIPSTPVPPMAALKKAESMSKFLPKKSPTAAKSDLVFDDSDESSLNKIIGRLEDGAIKQGAHGYRTLVVAEKSLTAGAQQALDLTRELSQSGKSVVLIDWETGSNSVATLLGMDNAPGINDLIEERVGFKDVVRAIPASSMHLMPMGTSTQELDGDARKTQLELILDALDETYDHIVAYGSYANAQELFRIAEGRFDAGVTICDSSEVASLKNEPDCFLGYTVEGIDVQHYTPPPESH